MLLVCLNTMYFYFSRHIRHSKSSRSLLKSWNKTDQFLNGFGWEPEIPSGEFLTIRFRYFILSLWPKVRSRCQVWYFCFRWHTSRALVRPGGRVLLIIRNYTCIYLWLYDLIVIFVLQTWYSLLHNFLSCLQVQCQEASLEKNQT